MLPFVAIVINMFMFATAVPFIRSSLDLPADSTSWLVAAYTVPNVVFMPFYGIWGDSVGKRRLLFSGLACFGVGSLICLASRSFDSIIIGRIIQGFGAASVTPLGISIIYEFTAEDKVGTMLGTWHMMGPVASTTGPILGGLIIDSFGWRSVFLPVSIVTAITLICLLLLIPKDNRRSQVSTIVRTFDWPGLFFVAGALTFLVFFISSRPITGRPPFRDWRLLIAAVGFSAALYCRERRLARPYFSFQHLAVANFRTATLCVAARMVVLGGVNFLIPLYASEVRRLPASSVGLIIMSHGAGFLFTMRLSGILADRWSSKWPPRMGLALQALLLAVLTVLPAEAPLALLVVCLAAHGAASGLSLASLNFAAMRDINPAETGSAAGLYAMLRFSGNLFGATFAGILLRYGLEVYESPLEAYQTAFLALIVAALVGFAAAFKLNDAVPD